MPYILQGTRDLVAYWNTLGRPCRMEDLASSTGIPKVNFMGGGRDRKSFEASYGEVEAQKLAGRLGVAVADVTENGGQVLI